MIPLAFLGAWGGVPEMEVDMYNDTGVAISIQAFDADGRAQKKAVIQPQQSKRLGRGQFITITVPEGPIQFDLPDRIRRWVPKVMPDGHIRYELVYEAKAELVLRASPYRLEIDDKRISLKLPTGDNVLLSSRSLCFPIIPRKNDQSEEVRDRAFSRQLRAELFQSIAVLEQEALQNKKIEPYLDKHTKQMLEKSYGAAPQGQ